MSKVKILSETFGSFSIGPFPSIQGADGEYHYVNPGYQGIWYEPNKSTSWQKINCWFIKERNKRHEMEQEWSEPNLILSGETTVPMLVTGDLKWKAYTVSTQVWPLSSQNKCGISFLYQDSRHFYWFCLSDGTAAELWQKNEEKFELLLHKDFSYDCDTAYTLKADIDKNYIACSINDESLFSLRKPIYGQGKIALAALTPARFLNIEAWMDQSEYDKFLSQQQAERSRTIKKGIAYYQPELFNVIDLKNFGAARSIRYGDLTGNGRIDLLFIQNQPLLNNGNECMISCMTAINLNGQILWQIGEPDPANGMITADVAVQIYDIDGDGKNEVIYCKDFKLIIADGITGETKIQCPTPKAISTKNPVIYENTVFDRIIGDSICICNFSGKAKPTDILIKDRYNNIWVYDNKLKFLWHRQLNTGHFPVSFDINDDGYDELIASHTLLDKNGNTIWHLPDMKDHVDEIVVGKFNPELDCYQIAMAAGEDGFIIVDQNGKILVQDLIGHVQRVSVAKYRSDLPGLQFCVVTYWRNTGIITYYDCCGKRIYSIETGANGNVLTPVNWTDQECQLILYSASVRYGGLFDGYGDRVVSFPNDGHPELCCDALDLLSIGLDGLLAWDTNKMYIYIQPDRSQSKIHAVIKNNQFNYSNYRAEFAWPRENHKKEKM